MILWRSRAADIAWIVFWLAASSAWCLSVSSRLGVTFDEPTYVAAGLERWRTGTADGLMRLGTMPLPVDVMTLPLFVVERTSGAPLDMAADTRGIATRLGDLRAALPAARAAMLPFWVLLVLAVWRTASQAGGRAAAYVAVALVAIEPTLLAHASLATTDLALTACVVAFGGAFAAGRDASWTRRVGLPALWFGLALLSKASAPVFCAAVVIAVELSQPSSRNRWDRLWRDAMQILSIGLAIAFVYCGSGWHTEPSFVAWTELRPDDWLSDALRFLSAHLTIFSNAGEAIVRQIAHNVRGHGVYILGHTDRRALWYYFPIAITIKMSAAVVLALVWLAIRSRRQAPSWPTLAALMILVASVTFRVQTGVRLILPVIPLIILGISVSLADAMRSGIALRRRAAAGAVCIAVLWTAVDLWRVWPDALRFTSELWGGTSRGYLRLSDSNYDWGQGLIDLRAWQGRNARTNLDLWYWGTDPRAGSGPWRTRPLHNLPLASVADVERELAGRVLAASTTLVYGSVPVDSARLDRINLIGATLRRHEPVDRTTTFLIYDFTNAIRVDAAARGRP